MSQTNTPATRPDARFAWLGALPVIGAAYRALDGWRRDFAPRDYRARNRRRGRGKARGPMTQTYQ